MRLENGDLILIKVNKFSTWYRRAFAKLIQFFDGVYYHHAQVYFRGGLYEANTKVVRQNLAYNDGDEMMVFRLKTPLTYKEGNTLQGLINRRLGQKYDYWGAMFHQLIYILTFRRIWIGRKGARAERKPYCTEFVTGLMFKLRGYFPEHHKIGPSRLLQMAPVYYELVYEGVYKHENQPETESAFKSQ